MNTRLDLHVRPDFRIASTISGACWESECHNLSFPAALAKSTGHKCKCCSGRHPGTFSDLPSWGRSRGSKRPRDDDDVEISDDEDEMAAGWSPGRRQHSGSFPDQVVMSPKICYSHSDPPLLGSASCKPVQYIA